MPESISWNTTLLYLPRGLYGGPLGLGRNSPYLTPESGDVNCASDSLQLDLPLSLALD